MRRLRYGRALVLWIRWTSLQGIGTALVLIIGAAYARDISNRVSPSRAHRACELFNTNLVADPGFEAPRITHAPYVPLVEGDSISAWVVLGSIDLISADYWSAAEGGQSVDLDGCGVGGVTQVVTTRAGATYELCFALSANPDGPPTIKTLEVLWDGRRVASLTVSSAGSTRQRMRWTYHRYDVVGRGGTSVLTFRSSTEGCYGAVIDDVKLQEKRAPVARSNLPSNDRVSLLP